MKKQFLYILIIPLLMLGCSSDPDDNGKPEGNLFANETSLEFPATGGRFTLEITAENLAKWEAYSKMSWIKLGEPDLENGTLEVTVEPTEEINDLEGAIVIYSDLKDLLNIPVTQVGNKNIYERSTLSRMNLHGAIEELSFYFNPVYMWQPYPHYMYNLKFDRSGMITYFEFITSGEEEPTVNYQVSISYDSAKRVNLVSVLTDEVLGDGNLLEYTVEFEYGNHGQYIESDVLFEYLEPNYYFMINYRTWLPAMIKDLTKIKVWNTGIVPRDFSIEIDVTGDTGVSKYTRTVDGEYRETDLLYYTFANGYTYNLELEGYFASSPVWYRVVYDIEPVSGYFKRINMHFVDDTDYISREKIFLQNLSNSLVFYYEALDWGYYMTLDYNDYSDITKITEEWWNIGAELEYDYDDNGNWTRVNAEYYGSIPRRAIDDTRTITYYR